MKYQIGFTVELQGEMSVEADTPEEAKEIVSDELRFISIEGAMADTTSSFDRGTLRVGRCCIGEKQARNFGDF